MNADLILPRLVHGFRLLFLGPTLFAPVLALLLAPRGPVGEPFPQLQHLAMLASLAVAWVPVSLLIARECVHLLFPPEMHTRWPLLHGHRVRGGELIEAMWRGPLGAAGISLGLLLSCFLGPVGWGMTAGGWLVGFGHRRVTFIPERRLLLLEGYLIPSWARLTAEAAVIVHVTEYRREHGTYASASSYEYRPVLVQGTRRVDLGEPTDDANAVTARAQALAHQLGVSYVINPHIHQSRYPGLA